MSTEIVERRARALSGLPRPVDRIQPWWQRHFVFSHSFWVGVVAVLVYGACLVWTYRLEGASLRAEIEAVTQQLGSPTELTWSQFSEAVRGSAYWASLTLAGWVVVFVLVDRLRPTTWTMKFVALGWGGAVATLVSLYLNTWMSSLINIQGAGDPTSAARAAIFVAPFVEESAKATVLFLLAIFVRYRIVSVLQTVTLAGLSAAGFAFTENILYYTRPFIYASKIVGVDPEAARMEYVVSRGLQTSFGHPLFTILTALGLAVALTNRSKLVRVVAPLAGFLFAVSGHMAFNGMASVGAPTTVLTVSGWLAMLTLTLTLVRRYLAERKLIAARLDDYVHTGWLYPRDPIVFSNTRLRLKLAFAALLRGRRVFRDTLAMQRCLSELAYLRASMTRGLVDAAGEERAKELLYEIRALRLTALYEPDGQRIKPDWWHKPDLTALKERLARLRQPRMRQVPALPNAGPPIPVSSVPMRPTASGPTANYPQ